MPIVLVPGLDSCVLDSRRFGSSFTDGTAAVGIAFDVDEWQLTPAIPIGFFYHGGYGMHRRKKGGKTHLSCQRGKDLPECISGLPGTCR
jgi:hypothetical protein